MTIKAIKLGSCGKHPAHCLGNRSWIGGLLFCKYDVNVLVNFVCPVEFLVFIHIVLVVITGGGSKQESSDTDHSQTTGKNQVK